jgi:ATP-binding cassette subfamily B (MDR/TAP) protein 1
MVARGLKHYNFILLRQSKKSWAQCHHAVCHVLVCRIGILVCKNSNLDSSVFSLDSSVFGFQYFICFPALIPGSQTASVIFAYALGISKAMNTTQKLQALFEGKPDMDNFKATGHKIDQVHFVGAIELGKVSFTCRSKKNRIVFDDLSLTFQPDRNTAPVTRKHGCPSGNSNRVG